MHVSKSGDESIKARSGAKQASKDGWMVMERKEKSLMNSDFRHSLVVVRFCHFICMPPPPSFAVGLYLLRSITLAVGSWEPGKKTKLALEWI